jgi:hypothetical protein
MPEAPYSHFSITLPPAVADRVRLESGRSGIKISTLMAKAVVAWLDSVPASGLADHSTPKKPTANQTSPGRKSGRFTNEEFDAIVARYRGTPPLVHAARLVLVEGYSQARATRESGVHHRQNVYRAIQLILQAEQEN